MLDAREANSILKCTILAPVPSAIRTTGSGPDRPSAGSVLPVAITGDMFPTPAADADFVLPLPAFLVFLAAATATWLPRFETATRRFMRLADEAPSAPASLAGEHGDQARSAVS